jgi:2-iminobutanoate/2-iminopropanoate deaminase
MYKLIMGVAAMTVMAWSAHAQPLSPNGVKTLSPPGAIKPTGTWNLGTRAGDFVFVAGMRGIDPATDQLVQGDEARIRQGFLNMKLIAESEGATLRDATRLVVYVTDMFRFRPLVNKVQVEVRPALHICDERLTRGWEPSGLKHEDNHGYRAIHRQ